jgi:hypothetical protein
VLGVDEESDTFVFRDRLVHVAHFAYDIRKRDNAKACRFRRSRPGVPI